MFDPVQALRATHNVFKTWPTIHKETEKYKELIGGPGLHVVCFFLHFYLCASRTISQGLRLACCVQEINKKEDCSPVTHFLFSSPPHIKCTER